MSRRRNRSTAAAVEHTTTVRELKNALSEFIASLNDSQKKLKQEINGIEQSKAEIQEELTAKEKEFVQVTLPTLDSENFDRFANLSKDMPGQGLAFFRQKLVKAREEALVKVNASLDETVDGSTFHEALEGAQEKSRLARAATMSAKSALDTAEGKLATWEKGSEKKFLDLVAEVEKSGAPVLTPDNFDYYTPKNTIGGVIMHFIHGFTRGAMYSKVTEALMAAGHNKGNINIIADLATYRRNKEALERTVTDMGTAYDAAQVSEEKTRTASSTLSKYAKDIPTDDQILAQVHEKLVRALNTPAFINAVALEFNEDFPSDIPLMSAKLASLDTLKDGIEAKRAAISANLTQVSAEWKQLDQANPLGQIKADIKSIKRDLRARQAEYENYTTAAQEARTRARTYQPTEVIVYNDNSWSLLQQLIIWDMLTSNRNTFTPGTYSSYTTDLMGINKGDYNLPATVFEVSNPVKEQMSEIGIDTGSYVPGTLVFDTTKQGGQELDQILSNVGTRIEASPYRNDTVLVTTPSVQKDFDVAADLTGKPQSSTSTPTVTREEEPVYVTVPSTQPTVNVVEDLTDKKSSWGTTSPNTSFGTGTTLS